jgi:MFS family permease
MVQDDVPMKVMLNAVDRTAAECGGDPGKSMPRPPLAFILVTIFLDMAGFGMVALLLPLFVQRHAGGALLAGALGSVYAVMQVLGAPLIGSVADRHGRKPVLIACLLGSFCAYLGIAFSRSLPALFAAVMFGGLMGGSFATAQAYIADGSGSAARTRWLGLAGAAMGLGVAVGPLLGGFLGALDLRVPALAAGGIALGNAVFGFFAIRDFPVPGSLASDRRNLRINPVRGIIDVFRHSELRPLLLTLAALNLCFAGLPSTFPLFSQARFGWTPPDNGLFFTFIGACAVLTQGFLVGRLAPGVGEARLAAVGAAMALVTFPLAAMAPVAWMLYPLLGLVAIGTGLGIPSLLSLVAHSAPESGVGRVMGGVQSVVSACMIAGPGLAGAAHQTFGPPAPYWMGAGFAAAAFTIVSLSRRRARKKVWIAGFPQAEAAALPPPERHRSRREPFLQGAGPSSSSPHPSPRG